MTNQRLKILFDIFLEPAEDEEDIRSYFAAQGEDPDALIEQAQNFVKQKEAELKLKIGRNKQNRASAFLSGSAAKLKNLGGKILNEDQDDSSLDGLGFAYRKQDTGINGKSEELKNQAEKLDKLKKFMDEDNEHTGKS